jgi:hypothetical protein
VREGDELPKKGWFSRTKQRPPSESTSTLHPPSISSVGKTQKSDQQAGDDGELPPREASASESPSSTSHAPPGTRKQPSDVADNTASELPSRAGFDLAAMRAVIEGIDGDKEKEKQRDVNGPAQMEIPPPLPPQGTVKKNSLSISSLVTTPPELAPISEYSSKMYNSTRSVSLDNAREARPFGFHNATEDVDEDSTSNIPTSSTFTPHSRVATDPTLSFKSDYKASWIPGVSEKDVFGGFGTPGGNSFHSAPFAAVDSTTMTAPPPKTSSASPAVALPDRDPWSFPSYSSDVSASTSVKKPSMFAANPWES